MSEINKGTRVINFVIDMLIVIIITVIIEISLNLSFLDVIFYVVYLLYYFIFESYNGQTIGKVITNTVVVDMHNIKPSMSRIGLRTVLRLNPFDGFSYLFGQEQGGHDLLSKTRLTFKKDVKSQ